MARTSIGDGNVGAALWRGGRCDGASMHSSRRIVPRGRHDAQKPPLSPGGTWGNAEVFDLEKYEWSRIKLLHASTAP